MDNQDEKMEPNDNSIPQALSTNNGSNTREFLNNTISIFEKKKSKFRWINCTMSLRR